LFYHPPEAPEEKGHTMCGKSASCSLAQMGDKELGKRLLEIFKEALRKDQASRPIPEGPHFVDDDETLACLSDDCLSLNERRKIREHFLVCPRCQSEFAAMLRAGVVTLPQSWAEDVGQQTDE